MNENPERLEHFRKLETMFHQAPFNQMLANRLTVGEGRSEILWEVDPRFFHGGGALHGALYFKLLDDAAYFAANSLERNFFLVTAEFHVHFLRPVGPGSLRCEGAVITAGKTLYASESRLYDARGREVGRGSGTFSHSRLALTDAKDYRL